MATKKTFEPLDQLLKDTGMTFNAIAKKSGIQPYTLYRLRQQPSKMDSLDIVKISNATGIDERKIAEVSLFFARKVDKLQQKAS
ncbi:helix-turn-helix transcriptional regulator [Lactococcus formosensis]|uniref:helix-turn-helix domain-containing protein n=1 Tax=Lactococcus TaxID=1357 RepID=UPI001897F764|nr:MULTISPECIES: helix-turn-helix transcriptional regulator [Lactococcus]MDB7634350.1 helix-turn-helix transcriptional regulator [Lactococcus garvieae]MDG6156154.1 helix-turn-helix transcriptional regulator [Lactococcus formosensis]MDT2725969.1 helix-turn-helix transcriptional regulator [Lactococcus formosensis]